MKNFEWVMKNYDRIVKPINKTVGYLFNKHPCYLIKKEHIIGKVYRCSSCFIKWLNSEANEDNNRIFNYVQAD